MPASIFLEQPAFAHLESRSDGHMVIGKLNARIRGLIVRISLIAYYARVRPTAGELTDGVVDGFLPWSSNVPDKCLFPRDIRDKSMTVKDDPVVDIDPYLFDDEMKNNQEEGL